MINERSNSQNITYDSTRVGKSIDSETTLVVA